MRNNALANSVVSPNPRGEGKREGTRTALRERDGLRTNVHPWKPLRQTAGDPP
jgi:hypothetical protein